MQNKDIAVLGAQFPFCLAWIPSVCEILEALNIVFLVTCAARSYLLGQT